MSPARITESFWAAPRRLARLLEDGEVTLTQYALLAWLGIKGADRDEGVATTYSFLAGLTGMSQRTIERGLCRLRELDLVVYHVGQGRQKPFRVFLGPNARAMSEGSSEVLSEPLSEVLSEGTSEVASDNEPALDHRNAASEKASLAPTASDKPSSDDSQTETQTENETGNERYISRLEATFDEHDLIEEIVLVFNRKFNTKFTSRAYSSMILKRIREHPHLGIEEHCAAIEATRYEEWIVAATPRVVYGNEAAFEEALSRAEERARWDVSEGEPF